MLRLREEQGDASDPDTRTRWVPQGRLLRGAQAVHPAESREGEFTVQGFPGEREGEGKVKNQLLDAAIQVSCESPEVWDKTVGALWDAIHATEKRYTECKEDHLRWRDVEGASYCPGCGKFLNLKIERVGEGEHQ